MSKLNQKSSLLSRCISAAATALLLALPLQAAQAQYVPPASDAAADFLPGENSSNVWTWGWKFPDGEFTAMVPIQHDRCGIYKDGEGEIPGFDCFTAYNSGWTIPQILKNNSGNSVVFKPAGNNTSEVVLGQYTLFLRQGVDAQGNPMYPIIRYTAPKTGVYDFLVSVQMIDKSAVGAVAHMTGVPDKELIGFGDAKHFQPVYPLQIGQSVDFWVTPVGNLFYDTTAVRMSVMKQ